MGKRLWLMLFTLTLVGSGLVSPTAALAQRADGADEAEGEQPRPHAPDEQTSKRYLVTYMNSQTGTAIRSATVVTVTNQSGGTCGVKVDWFKGFATAPECTTSFVLDNELTTDFCSRFLPDPITVCNATCAPELTFDEGRAVVSSTTKKEGGPDCSAIAVSARVYYTTGEGDDAIAAISDSKIVKVGQGNRGD
jgi:hypothetical protein